MVIGGRFFLFLHVSEDQSPEEAFKPTEVLFYVSSVLSIEPTRLRLVDSLVVKRDSLAAMMGNASTRHPATMVWQSGRWESEHFRAKAVCEVRTR